MEYGLVMLERLFGHAKSERFPVEELRTTSAWGSAALALLCSANVVSYANADDFGPRAPQLLAAEATSEVVPVNHLSAAKPERLPPVAGRSVEPAHRVASVPSAVWATPSSRQVLRLPPIHVAAAPAVPVAERLPPVATPSPYTDSPKIERLPPVTGNAAKANGAPAGRAEIDRQATQPAFAPPRLRHTAATTSNVVPYATDGYRPTVNGAPTPSQQRELNAVSGRADMLVRRGFSMAGRGAAYSARADFTEAMSMIAQTLDRQQQTDRHTKALAAGLRAISEGEQFQPIGSQLAADIDIATLVASHRTPVLQRESTKDGDTSADVEGVSLSEARDRYHEYASEQLAIAGGNLPVASLALYGLGKTRASQATERPTLQKIHFPAAMALYRAAARIDGKNFRATNELGVLAARLGQYEEARATLRQCIATAPTAESWRNLAVVHQRLGESDLARRAMMEASAARAMNTPAKAHPALVKSNVRWVPPKNFAQAGGQSFSGTARPASAAVMPPAGSQPNAVASNTAASNTAATKNSWSASKWLPWVKQ